MGNTLNEVSPALLDILAERATGRLQETNRTFPDTSDSLKQERALAVIEEMIEQNRNLLFSYSYCGSIVMIIIGHFRTS